MRVQPWRQPGPEGQGPVLPRPTQRGKASGRGFCLCLQQPPGRGPACSLAHPPFPPTVQAEGKGAVLAHCVVLWTRWLHQGMREALWGTAGAHAGPRPGHSASPSRVSVPDTPGPPLAHKVQPVPFPCEVTFLFKQQNQAHSASPALPYPRRPPALSSAQCGTMWQL